MENNVNFQDLLQLRELETAGKKTTGINTIAWVIGVVVVLAIIAFFWRHSSNTHNSTARELGFVRGELQSLVPTLVRIEGQMYNNHGAITGLSTHQTDFERFYFNSPQNGYGGYGCNGGGCGCGRGHNHGSHRFNREDTYALESQKVTVSDTCIS